jgi:uncharacterized protein (TIGR02453 family)
MPTAFSGFPLEAITFLRGLAKHNNRDWFLPRKPLFEEKVKGPMLELVAAVNKDLKGFAPEYVTDPAKAVYRYYRDTRFSKDKSPYKEHIAASFSRHDLTGEGGAGYYFAVSGKNVAIGGGAYTPAPETLLAIRNHIAEHPAEFRKIVEARTVTSLLGELKGEQLSRIPKGFAKGHAAEEFLRFKRMLFYVELPVELATGPELYVAIRKHFRAMSPFLSFLNAPLVLKGKTANRTKSS